MIFPARFRGMEGRKSISLGATAEVSLILESTADRPLRVRVTDVPAAPKAVEVTLDQVPLPQGLREEVAIVAKHAEPVRGRVRGMRAGPAGAVRRGRSGVPRG